MTASEEKSKTVLKYKLTVSDLKQANWQLFRHTLSIFAALAIIFIAALVYSVVSGISNDSRNTLLPIVFFSVLTALAFICPLVMWIFRLVQIKRRGESEYSICIEENGIVVHDLIAEETRTVDNAAVDYVGKNKAFIYLRLPDSRDTLILPNTYEADIATIHLARENVFENAVMQQRSKPLFAASATLAVLSFLSIFATFIIALLKGQSYALGLMGVNRYLWAALCFLPLPAAVVVCAFFQRRNRRRFTRLLVTGVLAAVILCETGFAAFTVTEDTYSRANVSAIELRTGLTFPDELSVVCDSQRDFAEINALVGEGDREEFKRQIASDERWLEELPQSLKDAAPAWLQVQVDKYGYFACYDETSLRFNETPAVGDKCVYACYNPDNGALYIIYDYVVPPES